MNAKVFIVAAFVSGFVLGLIFSDQILGKKFSSPQSVLSDSQAVDNLQIESSSAEGEITDLSLSAFTIEEKETSKSIEFALAERTLVNQGEPHAAILYSEAVQKKILKEGDQVIVDFLKRGSEMEATNVLIKKQ